MIAFLLPGFVFLLGIQGYSKTVTAWFQVSVDTAPTVGGFLYATLASMAVGLILSAVRWAVIDTIYHRTGIPPPRWNFGKLPLVLDAFESLADAHYHFYQFYSNMLMALVLVYPARLLEMQRVPWPLKLEDFFFIALCFVLILGSRDAMWKYYRRTEEVLSAGNH